MDAIDELIILHKRLLDEPQLLAVHHRSRKEVMFDYVDLLAQYPDVCKEVDSQREIRTIIE